jgi:P27 family predicted phage terminase small subunit
MPSGRKPKLSVVKNAEGNRSHATKDKTGDKIAGIGKLVVPSHLSEVERDLWSFVVRSLPDGLLCRADTAILERFVIAWSRYRECQKQIEDDGLMIKTPQGAIRHPLLPVVNNLSREMTSIGSELGLSPVAREKLSAARLDADDPMGWLLDGGGEE